MNDINELMEIISSFGGTASIDEIASAYAKRYKMPVSLVSKSVITSTLASCKGSLRLNNGNHKWESCLDTESNTLYVSDNRYFATIRDAMKSIFNKSVPLSQGYFDIDEGHAAWFPQPNNKNWLNILSEDGKFWHESPKVPEADYMPDHKLRYAFIHEEAGYRFTGLFKANGMKEDSTREYELVDDKVSIAVPRAPLVVCRVAYMKNYDGITADDTPVNGGSYVSENNDAFEKNNFHQYDDGFCYGFIETKYKSGHTADNQYAKAIAIEKIDPSCKDSPTIDGVRVVLVAFSPDLKKTVVVGWYDNATVYRNRVVEEDKIYMTRCVCQDAHLIPESERTFEVPKAGGSNAFGIGQSNFWYIQTFDIARDFETQLTEYIDSFVNDSSSIFERCGFIKTNSAVRATEYSFKNIVVYTVDDKRLNAIVHPDLKGKIDGRFATQMFHSTALNKFPKRQNGGQGEIHYGYKCKFDTAQDLADFLSYIVEM